MSFLTALFKNPLERAFQRQSLTVDLQRPLQCGYTSYAAVYNGNAAQVLLYPKETEESAFLLRHPAIIRIHAYTKYTESGIERWAVLTDPLQPVIDPPMQLIALKASLLCLQFLESNSKSVARFSRSAMALQHGNAVFTQLDAIRSISADFSAISGQLADCFKETAQFGVKFSGKLAKMLGQPSLAGEVFEILESFGSGYKDTQFLQKMVDYARGAEPLLVAQILLPMVQRQLELDFNANLYKTACIMAYASAEKLPPDVFALLVRFAIDQPDLAQNLLYFKGFSQLDERSAKAQHDLVVFLLQKQHQNSTLCKLAELASLLFKQNARMIAGSFVLSEQFFQMIGRVVKTFQAKTEYLTSWNLLAGCAALLQEASPSSNLKETKQSTQALAQLFVQNVLPAALTSISQCYDCIEAMLCCSRVLQQLADSQLLQLYAAMSTAHALRYALYSSNKQQRELAIHVRTYIDQKLTPTVDQASQEPQQQPEKPKYQQASSKPVVAVQSDTNSDSEQSESQNADKRAQKAVNWDSSSDGEQIEVQNPTHTAPSVVQRKTAAQQPIASAQTEKKPSAWESSEETSEEKQAPKPKPAAKRQVKKAAWDDSDD